jgi:MoaA/NifB/PqqE/SkfB family radical SAM enzyme
MFSIIMPVWNRANLVSRAIDSVLAQTFKDFELIIIDDGSEDNLQEVVRPYLSEKVFFYRFRRNRGLSAARNYGIEKSVHPFIAYLDSDNCWDSEFLARMREALQGSGASREIAYCMAKRYRKDPATGNVFQDGIMGQPFSFKKLMEGNYIDINTFVHSRKALEFAGNFDEKLRRLEDWDIILRMTSLFEPVFVPHVLADYYFCVADNALSIIENLEKADTAVRRKHAGLKMPVTFVHDTVPYTWDNLSEEKYRNWVRIHHEQLNTSDYTAWGYPFMLQIEPTNICNLRCPLCPVANNDLGRKPRNMKYKEYTSIIDDLESYLMILILWDWGEPFMNPDFPRMIRYASDRDIRTVTSTNAHFLDNETYVKDILQSGLSTLIVAIDSARDDNYEAYRKRGNLNKALSGLQKVVEMKKKLGSKTLIHMRMVIMRHNEDELWDMKRLAREIGVDWFSVKAVTPGYREPDPEMDKQIVPRRRKYRFYAYKLGTYERIRTDALCRRPWEMSSILSNGDVVPCCWDYDDVMKVGNVFEEPFTKIWTGPVYRDLRKKIFHERQSLARCTICPPSFKLSKSGWFPVVADFINNPSGHFKSGLKKQIRTLLGGEISSAVNRRLKKLLGERTSETEKLQ